jgi:lysozyme family protein
MATWTYDEALKRLLAHEGGYSNHPSDPGGPTNYGITLADYRRYIDSNGTAADVRRMTVWQAKAIYRARYWDALDCDALPAGVDYAVFDYGVNSGIGRSGKVLRRVLGLGSTSYRVTPEVLRAVATRNPAAIVDAICDERLRFLKSLRTWPVFGRGWGRRVAEVRAAARSMATRSKPVIVPHGQPARGKGHIPQQKTVKEAMRLGLPAGAMAVAAWCWDWVAHHPATSTVIAVGIAVLIVLALSQLKRCHAARQQQPMPDTAIVPASSS